MVWGFLITFCLQFILCTAFTEVFKVSQVVSLAKDSNTEAFNHTLKRAEAHKVLYLQADMKLIIDL